MTDAGAVRAPGRALRALAALYGGAAALRNRLYDGGVLPSFRAPVPVLSLGNLTFGGSGKTPAAIWLAGALERAGERVGVVSRGYGGQRAHEPLVVARGAACLADVSAAGDEPLLVALEARPHVVVVGRDRVAAAAEAAAAGATVVVLDDGFQHRRLARDLDIVLVGGAWLSGRAEGTADLPREPAAALARADVVLLTADAADGPAPAGPLAGPDVPPRVRAALARRPGPSPLVVRAVRVPGRVTGADGTALTLAGRRVLAVCGIARPGSFAATLHGLGATVAEHLVFADHHPYSAADAERIARRARDTGAELVVTTAKDRLRWPAGAPAPAVASIVLEVPAEGAVLACVRARLDAARGAR